MLGEQLLFEEVNNNSSGILDFALWSFGESQIQIYRRNTLQFQMERLTMHLFDIVSVMLVGWLFWV